MGKKKEALKIHALPNVDSMGCGYVLPKQKLVQVGSVLCSGVGYGLLATWDKRRVTCKRCLKKLERAKQ